ncbi:MAG TPA: hypothetical protein VJ891_17210 [Casimicrobiaceae bacterium]|nr:hypothetical protein [Casimicrobiaceae bacterium]
MFGFHFCERHKERLAFEQRLAVASGLQVIRLLVSRDGEIAFSYAARDYTSLAHEDHNRALDEGTARMAMIEVAYRAYPSALRAFNAALGRPLNGTLVITDDAKAPARLFLRVSERCCEVFENADRARAEANMRLARNVLGEVTPRAKTEDTENRLWQLRSLFSDIQRNSVPAQRTEWQEWIESRDVGPQYTVGKPFLREFWSAVAGKDAPAIASQILDAAASIDDSRLPQADRRWLYEAISKCIVLVFSTEKVDVEEFAR